MSRIGKAAADAGLDAGAVSEVAKLGEHNAERGAHRLFGRWGMRLNVPMSYVVVKSESEKAQLRVPYLKVSDYIQTLLRRFPCSLFGGCKLETARQKCGAFWRNLYSSQPTHAVYSHFSPQQLDDMCILPIVLHGDEGTGYKKQPVAIGSFEAVFGLQNNETGNLNKRARFRDCSSGCAEHKSLGHCCKVPDHWPRPDPVHGFELQENDFQELMNQWHNTKGHSFLSRFLSYVLPTTMLDKGPWVLDGVLHEVTQDLRSLFHKGFEFNNMGFRVAVVGLKGDAKWHIRVGRFFRSYMRLGEIRNYAICPDCHAGEDAYPFEYTGNDPAWTESFGASLPWADPGPMENIPFDDKLPSTKYKRDMLHSFKLGLGREICGGCVILLCKFFAWFDTPRESRSVVARLARAYSRFSMFCSASHNTPHCRSFTKDFMHYKTARSYPFTASKGSDTMLLLSWLSVEFSSATRQLQDHRRLDLLQAAAQTCKASGELFGFLYGHGLWLPRICMEKLRDKILTVVRGFSYLACGCEDEQLPAFRYKSTLHSIHHFAIEIDIALQQSSISYLNPLIFDCSQSEDFIGRSARTARAVHGRTTALRTIQRHLVKTHARCKRFFGKAGR